MIITTIEEAFLSFKQKTQKNITNNSKATDRGRFVRTFNEVQNRIIEIYLQNRGMDDIEDISLFLKPDFKISPSKNENNRQFFSFPKNYFDFSSMRAFATKNNCKKEEIKVFKVKSENLSEILKDEYNKPSFDWREAPFTINDNAITLFNEDDFSFDYILLNYYRYPNQIELINPKNPESRFNEAIPIEWDKKMIDRIISICSGETDINLNNQRFQLQTLRAKK